MKFIFILLGIIYILLLLFFLHRDYMCQKKDMGEVSPFYKQSWFLKSVFTIGVSQAGFFIAILIVYPAINPADIYVSNLKKYITDYLFHGNIFLTIVVLGSTLMAEIYFMEENGNGTQKFFETHKKELVYIICIIILSAISYALEPSENMFYFSFLQIIFFALLIILMFKLNLAKFYKEQGFDREMQFNSDKIGHDSKELNEINMDGRSVKL